MAPSLRKLFYGMLVSALILSAGFYYWSVISGARLGTIDRWPTETDKVGALSLESEPLSGPETEPVSQLPVILEPVSPVLEIIPEKPVSLDAARPKEQVDLPVPFTSQAPLFNWDDPRQQDGCEEASVLMAMAWVREEAGVTAAEWEKKIIALADWAQEKYGEHRDISVSDVVSWLLEDYFSYHQARIKSIKNSAQLRAELEAGHLILAPVNGQALGNPHFTSPGPAHHFLVIKGYDYRTQEFITNDPGTRLGKNYRYPAETIYRALRAYPTGYHEEYTELSKEVIVVGR